MLYRPFTKIRLNFKKIFKEPLVLYYKTDIFVFSNKNKPQYKKPKYVKNVTKKYNKDNNTFKTYLN